MAAVESLPANSELVIDPNDPSAQLALHALGWIRERPEVIDRAKPTPDTAQKSRLERMVLVYNNDPDVIKGIYAYRQGTDLPADSSNDEFALYMRSVRGFKTLTKGSEQLLARTIVRGVAARGELDQDPKLLRKHPELVHAFKSAVLAQQIMFLSNIRLVVSIAKRYKADGAELSDLVQEGNFGLERAIEKFDPDKGFKFSTYATWWIRQAIERSFRDFSHNILLPNDKLSQLSAIYKAKDELEQKIDHAATSQEISNMLFNTIEPEEIEFLLQISQDASLNTLISDDSDTELGDVQPVQEEQNSYDKIDDKLDLSRAIDIVMRYLDDEEKIIFSLRHAKRLDEYIDAKELIPDGILDEAIRTGKGLSMAATASYLGIGVRRIRSIESRVNDKMLEHCPSLASVL